MRDVQYFFAHPADVSEKELRLRDDEAKHCAGVLRKTVGDAFFAVDGAGHEYAVTLAHIEKTSVVCTIQEVKFRPTELPFDITLGQALIKKDLFDLIVEKTTELGVQTLIPMRTTRSLPDPSAHAWTRWNKILISAMKQSRRSVLPVVKELSSLEEIVRTSGSYDVKIIFHERSGMPFLRYAEEHLFNASFRTVLVLVGPEGGFTESETALAVEHGFISLSMGPRRLRAETAAISALVLFSNMSCRQSV